MPRYDVPFGAQATTRLAGTIRALKAGDPLAPVTVAVPSNYAGLSLRRTIGYGDHRVAAAEGLTNVRFMVLARVAEFLGAPALAAEGKRPLTPVVTAELARQVLAADPGPLAAAAAHPSTIESLVHTFDDLRRAPDPAVAALTSRGARAAHVAGLYAAFRSRAQGYYDQEDLSRAAAVAVRSGAGALRDIGHVILYLPQQQLSPGEQHLLQALDSVGALTEIRPADQPPSTSGTRVVASPDPEEEVRTAARLILQACQSGAALDGMALLHPAAQPYALLVHSVFAAAGLPFNGPAPHTLAQSMAGRFLLAALQLPGQDYRREPLLDWLTSCPVRLREGESGLVPGHRWEVLARNAAVVRGRDQWAARLTTHIERLQLDRAEAEHEGRPEAAVAAMARDIDQAGQFRDFLAELFATLQPPVTATWESHALWARGVLDRYLGRDEALHGWDDGEVASYTAVLAALEELSALPDGGAVVTPAVFLNTLQQQLQASAGRPGRFGHGVFVGSYRDALGAQFEWVFLVGMNEGLVPTRGADDPLLPDAERPDGMPQRATRPQEQHTQYLAALAAAPERVLLYARADPRAQQARLPSRWLLEMAGRLHAQATGGDADTAAPLSSEELERTTGGRLSDGRAWFAVVPSFEGGLVSDLPAVSQGDYDLRSLLQWRRAGVRAAHYLLRPESGLARALDGQRARRNAALTAWDGLVTPAAPLLPPDRAVSATALQTWAECPLHHFLGSVLHVAGTQRPEEIVTITALERGSLIHAALEAFLKQVAPRTSLGQVWTAAERQLLRDIAARECDAAAARGVTGKPLLWELARAQILRDVDGFLDADEALRAELGVMPAPDGLELRFGNRGRPVTRALPDGRTVAFQGVIDRLDVSADGKRVVVLDYKSGRSDWYKRLPDTVIEGGRRLQLPMYGLAASALHAGADVEAYYWFVTEGEGYKRIGYPVDGDRLRAFDDGLATIVAGIDAGLFPANPGKQAEDHTFSNCRFCPFDRCCPADRAATWQRKRQDPAVADYLTLTEGR